jgi:exonuclease SbcD
MKLLHTSDWHVGKSIRGASRAEEHTAVLAEIAGIAHREGVDLIVVAGDLFDSSTPAPESEEIVYRSLLALAKTGADVAVIAGNHDNARRLRAISPLLRLGNVHLRTTV